MYDEFKMKKPFGLHGFYKNNSAYILCIAHRGFVRPHNTKYLNHTRRTSNNALLLGQRWPSIKSPWALSRLSWPVYAWLIQFNNRKAVFVPYCHDQVHAPWDE